MDYWNSQLTEKSWKILQELRAKFEFTLIGGWAVYLWTKAQKSQDIDIIISFETLSILKGQYEMRKNERLRKYEIKLGEIDIDIYVPHYSKLALPLEDIQTETVEGFRLAKPEFLLMLKQGAELDRSHSLKGEKDRLDIMSLLFYCDLDFKLYSSVLKKYKNEHLHKRLLSIVKSFMDYKYFGLTPRQLKLKKKFVLEKLSR